MSKGYGYARLTFYLLTISALLLLSSPTFAKTADFQIDYTVKISSLDKHLFHVTTDIKNIDEAKLTLSLPTWTPGWYTIENYAKNILRFKITDSKGNSLPFLMTRKQTWQVATKNIDAIKIEFDYRAEILALNQAKIAKDFAFFTGTELFLMAEDHRRSPSQVHFDLPTGWRILSALTETSDPMTFHASDYDMLVDSPTEMGNFDITKFEVAGKPHYFAATPAGAFSQEKTARFVEMLKKIVVTERAVFQELPYEKYLYFYFFLRPESNAGGALEHANSHVLFGPSGDVAQPESLIDTAAHEFFHLWNVKRLRPAEMWPYDYSRENETPSLWVSEGFTSYYGALAQFRAGIIDQSTFLQSMNRTINGVEDNDAHRYISPANSSTSTWLGYDTPMAFEISYYTQGMNLGALLDISIRNDTKGQAGLDDVMRTLYHECYLNGKGFTTEDMIKTINRITKQKYDDFFRDYILGVEPIPYEKIYGYAGYLVEKSTVKSVVLGVDTSITSDGNIEVVRVEPGSTAETAGIKQGDILLQIDGIEIRRRAREVFTRMQQRIGQNVKLLVYRNNKEETLDFIVGSQDVDSYQLKEAASPTPAQIEVRSSWLQSIKALAAGGN